MKLDIQITGADAVAKALREIGTQAPYALALALNATANSAQRSIRMNLPGSFTLRKPEYIERTIFRKPGQDFATKNSPRAAVRIHDERDQLAKFEEGGDKRARDGRNVAIPLAGVKRNARDIVTTGNRPKALMGKPGVVKVGDTIFKTSGRGKAKRLTALYLLKPSVRIRPLLRFHATAARVIDGEWAQHAADAITKAITSAR